MSYRTNLIARRDAIAAELADMSSSTMGGKANVKSQDGGTTIDHVGYRKSLLDELKSINDEIIRLGDIEAVEADDDGPFEIESVWDA